MDLAIVAKNNKIIVPARSRSVCCWRLKWNLISPPPPNATVFTGDISEPFLRAGPILYFRFTMTDIHIS